MTRHPNVAMTAIGFELRPRGVLFTSTDTSRTSCARSASPGPCFFDVQRHRPLGGGSAPAARDIAQRICVQGKGQPVEWMKSDAKLSHLQEENALRPQNPAIVSRGQESFVS